MKLCLPYFSWQKLKVSSTIIIASLLLSGAAFYNGYPLIYPDTGGYIGLQNLSFRSFFYNLFIYPSVWFHSLWAVVFVQSLIVAHLLHLVLRVVFRVTSLISYLLMIVLLCIFTSLPWITGFIMPDIFTGVMLLSLFLILLCRENLCVGEKIYLFILIVLSATVHLTHIPLAVSMIIIVWLFRVINKKNKRLPMPNLLKASLAIFLAFILVIANNYRTQRVFTLSPGGYAFLLARLVADGPAVKYLEKSCPEKKYKLCDYLQELPSNSSKFLWPEDSPFRKVGWIDGYQKEGSEIVRGTIILYPFDVAKQCLKNTVLQSVKFLTHRKSCLDALYVCYPLWSYYPNEFQEFEKSKQSQNRLNLRGLNYLHLVFSGLALLAAGIAFLIFFKQPQYLSVIFLYFIGVAYLLQALLTGCLSVPDHRFGGRMIWLLPFFSIASLMHIMNHWKEYVWIKSL